VHVRTEVVRGKPIEAGGRAWVPLVQRTAGGQQKLFVGAHSQAARGMAFARLRPLGLLEQRDGAERFVAIHDQTRETLLGLLVVALVVPILLMLGAWLSRRIQKEPAGG